MSSEQGGEARVLLYVQLASALRDHVRNGEWKAGDCIPTIEELCVRYDVSRNTMRQALSLLRDEGLLESTRGRGTVVLKLVEDRKVSSAIVDAISNPLRENKSIKIVVLDRRRGVKLPPELFEAAETVYDSYVHIRKLHIHREVTFGFIDIYIASHAYARLPRRADERQLISRLLVSHADVRFSSWAQETTVGYPDREIAKALDYSMTRPVVLLRRRRLDQDDKIVLAGEYRFRADHFLLRTSGEGQRAPQPTMDTVDEIDKQTADLRLARKSA